MFSINGGQALRLILVLFAGWAGTAEAYCTTRERIQLRNEGVPPAEIERLCSAPQQAQVPMAPLPPPMPRMRFASQCMTRAGPCAMAVAMPIGASCACYTAWGAIPGVAQ